MLALLAALLPACDRGAPGPPAPADAPVLLLGGDVFAGGDRVARRIQRMAELTGVLGNSIVRLVHVPGAGPAELARALEDAGPARAALAFPASLALLDGIDPSSEEPEQRRLTSRRIDWKAFDADIAELRAVARERGTHLAVCTPPLGLQGRVEVPELADVAERLRRRGPVFDLTATFRALEPGPHFSNGIDRLDDDGHDELAHAIFRALLGDQAPVPARGPAELRARRVQAALHAWAAGDDDALAGPGLAGPTDDRRQAALQAAVALAGRGLDPSTQHLWSTVAEAGPDAPGAGVGRLFAGLPPGAAHGFEAELAAVLWSLVQADPAGLAAAEALTTTAPQRIEAWLALQLAQRLQSYPRTVAGQARGRILAFDGGPLADARALRLLGSGPAALFALPALLAVQAPYEDAAVTGPALRAARRKARLGLDEAALKLLDGALAAGICPPHWHAERQRLAAPAR